MLCSELLWYVMLCSALLRSDVHNSDAFCYEALRYVMSGSVLTCCALPRFALIGSDLPCHVLLFLAVICVARLGYAT